VLLSSTNATLVVCVLSLLSDIKFAVILCIFRSSREDHEKTAKKTVFAFVSQTDEKKLYVKILPKNIENDSDNFATVTNELEYCYIIKCWILLLFSVFADAPNYHKRKS